VARRYVQRVDILYAAESIEDLHRMTVLRFHPLKGNRKGQYAVSLTDRARLILTFTESVATIVWIEEVSKHYGD
jgi:proteic killer suppression protein